MVNQMWQEYEVGTEKLACVRKDLDAERRARLCEREEWEREREDLEREREDMERQRWAQAEVFQEALREHEKGNTNANHHNNNNHNHNHNHNININSNNENNNDNNHHNNIIKSVRISEYQNAIVYNV